MDDDEKTIEERIEEIREQRQCEDYEQEAVIDTDDREELRKRFLAQIKNPARVQQMMRDDRPVYPRRLERGRKG